MFILPLVFFKSLIAGVAFFLGHPVYERGNINSLGMRNNIVVDVFFFLAGVGIIFVMGLGHCFIHINIQLPASDP